MRATIYDVAREAGCSTTAVSLVLNGSPNNMSEQKRQAIREAAANLSYRPNRQAASLVTKRSRTLGLIIPDNCNAFFGTIAKEIEAEARIHGYNVIYGNSDNRAANDLNYISMFMERCVDGIVFVKSAAYGEADNKRLRSLLLTAAIPFVLLDRGLDDSNAPTFSVDHSYGGYIATKHLISLGHKRIGCYTGPLDLASAQGRLLGYRIALEEAGIPYREKLVFEGDYQLGLEQEAFRHFERQQVTAIFSQNDMMAYGLYRQIQLAGKRIPQDYAIVGFDDLELSTVITPSLTTVQQPVIPLSHSAISCLIQMIERPNANTSASAEAFSPTLIVRDSTCGEAPKINILDTERIL